MDINKIIGEGSLLKVTQRGLPRYGRGTAAVRPRDAYVTPGTRKFATLENPEKPGFQDFTDQAPDPQVALAKEGGGGLTPRS